MVSLLSEDTNSSPPHCAPPSHPNNNNNNKTRKTNSSYTSTIIFATNNNSATFPRTRACPDRWAAFLYVVVLQRYSSFGRGRRVALIQLKADEPPERDVETVVVVVGTWKGAWLAGWLAGLVVPPSRLVSCHYCLLLIAARRTWVEEVVGRRKVVRRSYMLANPGRSFTNNIETIPTH